MDPRFLFDTFSHANTMMKTMGMVHDNTCGDDGGGGGHPVAHDGEKGKDKAKRGKKEETEAAADMLIALEKDVLRKNNEIRMTRTERRSSDKAPSTGEETWASKEDTWVSNQKDAIWETKGTNIAVEKLQALEKEVLNKSLGGTTLRTTTSAPAGTSNSEVGPEHERVAVGSSGFNTSRQRRTVKDTNSATKAIHCPGTSGGESSSHDDASSVTDQQRLQDMKTAAALVIAADEAVASSRESEGTIEATTLSFATSTENTASVAMQESNEDSSPTESSLEPPSSQGDAMQNQLTPEGNDVLSDVSAQPGTPPRPMPPQDIAHVPGAHAVLGPDPPDSIVDRTATDEELGENDIEIQAEAHVVDETAERDRLHQEIISNAPRAAILDVTWKDLSSRVLWTMAVMFASVALVLGLSIGLSTRPAKAILPYNDMCANALPVPHLPFVYKGTIEENSTTVESEALDCSLVKGDDVGNWFQVQGIPGLCIRASIVWSDSNASLSVYEGDCNELNCLHDTKNTPESTVFWKSKQRSYYLLVSADSTSFGQYQLDILGYKCIENDACDTASGIGSLPFSSSGSTSTATPETDAALYCSNSPVGVTRGVFYSIPGSGSCMNAATSGSDFNTTLAVYEGSCSEMVCRAQELSAGTTSENGTRIGWSSQVGVEYKLLVAGHDGSVGNYSLTVEENKCDKCSGAIVIGGLPFSDTADTEFADDVEMVSGQSPCPLIRNGYKGVWYTMKTSSYCTAVSTERSDFDFDTVVALYEGTCCDSLSCVAENDDKFSCLESCKGSGITWIPSSAGATYWILVAGMSEQTGRYGIDVSVRFERDGWSCGSVVVRSDVCLNFNAACQEKLCDRCQDAISVGSLPYSSSYSNTFAGLVESRAVEECLVIKSDNRGVWYRLRGLGSGACMTASTIGSELDTVLAVYDVETIFDAGGCEALKCLNSNNNLPPAPDRDENDAKKSQVFWRGELSAREDRPRDYYIFVGGSSSLVGSYNLSIYEYECLENDDCDNAIVVESLPYFYAGTTVDATSDHRSGALQCSIVQQSTRGVWHEFVGTGTCVSISLGSDFNDAIAVYDGECGSLRCVTYDMNRITEEKSKLTWNTEVGTLYKVFVAGFEDIVGTYNISIEECMEKSECLTAHEISDLPFRESDSLSNSSLTRVEFRHAEMCDRFYWFGSHGLGYWYTVEGTGSCISISTADSNLDLDTVIAVYEGSCGDLTCVTDNDDGPVDWTSDASWLSTAGTTYTVLIAGLDTGPGPLIVDVNEYPCLVDDNCAGATIIDTIPFAGAGSTVGATPEIISDSDCLLTSRDDHPEFFASNSSLRRDETRGVWYGVDGGLDSCLNVSMNSSLFPVLAAVYEGECGSLVCKGRALGGFAWNSTGDATSYKILVAAPAGLIGNFNLMLTAC